MRAEAKLKGGVGLSHQFDRGLTEHKFPAMVVLFCSEGEFLVWS